MRQNSHRRGARLPDRATAGHRLVPDDPHPGLKRQFWVMVIALVAGLMVLLGFLMFAQK